MMGRAGLVAVLGLLLSAATAEAPPAQAGWIASWRAVLTPALPPGPGVPPWRASPVLDNQTLVQEMRLSTGGRRWRINFSNECGHAPRGTAVARVSVVPASGTAPRADRQITFSGRPG